MRPLLPACLVLAPVLLLPLAGCPAPEREGSVTRDRFVQVMVDLRSAEEATAAQRDSILTHHGVAEDDLRAFVRARADRPRELAEIWDDIADGVAARRDG